MAYEYAGTLPATARSATQHACEDYIWGGMARPYPETLAATPAELAAECVKDGWITAERMSEWGITDHDVLSAMTAAHAEAVRACAE